MASSTRLTVAAALVSAVMLWVASPAGGAGWLVWVALVPVAAAVIAAPGARRARIAVPLAYAVYLQLLLVPAFPFGLAEGQWGDPVVPVLVAGSPVLAIALVAIPAFAALLYLLRFGEPWGASVLPPRLAAVALVTVPALAWTALDFARASLDPGGLWGPLFLSQSDRATGAIAGLAGPWLLTFLIVAVNYGIAVALVRRRIGFALAPAAAVLAIALAAPMLERGREPGAELRVAAVQPGYDTAERDQPPLRHFRSGTYDLAAADLVDDLGVLTREATAAGAELVVWPEASMYVDPREEPAVRRALVSLAQETGAAIVVPFFLPSPVGTGEVLVVVPSSGGAQLTETRPKHRPLWFIGERGAGGEPAPLDAGALDVGVLFGTDTQAAGNGAGLAEQGAELLASATHDWRQSAGVARAYAQLGARAAGLPLVRADWRYRSAIYAADGELLADAGDERRRTALVADLRRGAPSPYAALGDAVGWLAVAAVALAGAAAAVVRLGRPGALSRGAGRAGGGRGPGRGSPRRRPSRGRPRAAAAPRPPPP